MFRLCMVAALSAAVSLPASAQRLGPPAERPRLEATADTNDAQAYYERGVAEFEHDPEVAGAAFYWAARLNPGWGDPLYGRRAALLLRTPFLLNATFERDRRRLGSDEARRLDSLQFRALMLNPFLYRRLDRPMFIAYIVKNAEREHHSSGGMTRPEIEFEVQAYLTGASNQTRAWMEYGYGNFAASLRSYAQALGQSRDRPGVHLERARIFGMRAENDSAIAEFNAALSELRKQDDKELVVFYESKALAEYSVGVLLEGAGKQKEAREAYGKALQEDLAYYPAHLRLGMLAIGLKDTATAVSELGLATQLAEDEPYIRYMHGYALARANRLSDAIIELKKATVLEPYYALPNMLLGQLYEHLGKGPEAAATYERFLALAPRGDPQRAIAESRLKDVKEVLEFAPKP